MELRQVRLSAPTASLGALAEFYGAVFCLDSADVTPSFRLGETRLEFLPAEDEPFYHFALLVPGNRFDAALDWIGDRAELLPDRETDGVVFDFTNWRARACYFHDPAGNIVELIAHRGVAETSATGPFAAAELVGLSELGLVGDTAAMARVLGSRLGLELWDGTVEVEGRLAFVGEPARTLILSPSGRGWLPTGRPAEAHPLEVVLSGPSEREALIGDSLYKIRSVAQATTR